MASKSERMPIAQILVLAFCRLCQPLALGATMAYLPEYLEVLGVSPSQIALKASLIIATFALCESAAAIPWAALSDIFGRKPIVLGGLMLAMCSNLGFGFSTRLWQTVLCTGLAGISSGNVGVLRTVLAEVVPQPNLQAQAFAVLPAAAGAGFILGPALGGYSSHAAKQFEPSNILRQYRFALPNICTATLFLLGAVVAFSFLSETRARRGKEGYRPLPEQDPTPTEVRMSASEQSRNHEPTPLAMLDDMNEVSDSSRHTDDIYAPRRSGKTAAFLQHVHDAFTSSFRHLANATVWSFSLVTLSSSGYDNLLPIFLHYGHQDISEEDTAASMGLGKDTKTVGLLLTSYGIVGLIATLFLNPLFCKIWPPSRVLRGCAIGLPILYVVFAYVVGVPQGTVREALVCVCMITKMCLSISAMQSCLVVMPRSVKPEQLASLHGLNATLAAFAKATGSIIGGVAFSVSAQHDLASGPWWTLAIVAGLAIFPSFIAERALLS